MRSAFSLQVSATVVLCHVKLMSGVLSLEVREQMLCSGLCNSAVTSIVYLFTSFLGSDVNVETRCIVQRVNIHILICTLNVRETSDDWQTGIFNISCTSRGFCRGCPWDLENCSVCLRCSGSMWCIARKKYMWCFHWSAWAVDKKIIRESLHRSILSGPLGNGRVETAGGWGSGMGVGSCGVQAIPSWRHVGGWVPIHLFKWITCGFSRRFTVPNFCEVCWFDVFIVSFTVQFAGLCDNGAHAQCQT